MITYIFMAICIAVFVYINYFSKDNKTSEAMHLGALYTPYVKNRGEYWRFITSAFIHTEFLHLFMNMYCIFYLGRLFETGTSALFNTCLSFYCDEFTRYLLLFF